MCNLRRIALDLLRADTSITASLEGTRKTAAWDNICMVTMFRG